MTNAARNLVVATLAATVTFSAAESAIGAPRKAAPSPSPGASAGASSSASPAPLPTATPEPPGVAIPRLEAKLKANPGDKEAMQELAGYYLGGGRADQALGLTQKLLAGGTNSAQVYYMDGIANQSLGRIKEATADFEQATNREPTNSQILLTLTDLYLRTNRTADAERVAKRATTFNATDKRAFENYGLVLGQEGKFDDARAQFETAAKLDPKDAQPIVLEARTYVSQKALALAAKEYDRALTVDPKYVDALFGKASLQAQNHDVPNAIASYESLLAVEPTDEAKAAVLVAEYQLYRNEKMNDQALAVLKRADQNYGKVPAVHIAYGDYLVSIGKDQAGAEAQWKTALGSGRDNPDALGRLAELAIAQNKRSDALGYFKRLTEVVPNDPTPWATLGAAYAQNNQLQNARNAYRHSFELARSPQALAGIAAVDYQMKNFKECSQVLAAIDRGAADYLKGNPQLLFLYGKCAQSTGDKAVARTAYTRVRALFKPGSQAVAEIDKALRSLGPDSKAKPSPKPRAAVKSTH